jgi:hypothetical protein
MDKLDKNHIKTRVVKESDKAVIKYTAPVYFIAVGILYLLYIITFLGVFYVNPEYIKYVSLFVRILICFFLMYRFNPFRAAVLHPLDSTLIFAAAILLIIDLFTTEFSLGTFTSVFTKNTAPSSDVPLYSNIFDGVIPMNI